MLMLAGSFLGSLELLPRLAVWALPEPGRGDADEAPRGPLQRLGDLYARLLGVIVRAP